MDDAPQTVRVKWSARLQTVSLFLRRSMLFAAGIAAALLVMVIYNMLFPPAPPLSERDVRSVVAAAMASATPLPAYSTQVYQVIQPSLVLIQVSRGAGAEKEDYGLGSGVVIDTAGNILTSLHVVEAASEITLVFFDGRKSGAVVLAALPEKDIAVLQSTEPPQLLVPAVLGNLNAMRVGDEAYVVGNPFGLYSSMSAGVISGFDRIFKVPDSDVEIEGMIQVDAAVNPGNSGGPLLNRSGHVIGIVTGIVNPAKQSFFVGVGFAVPINVAVAAIGNPPPY